MRIIIFLYQCIIEKRFLMYLRMFLIFLLIPKWTHRSVSFPRVWLGVHVAVSEVVPQGCSCDLWSSQGYSVLPWSPVHGCGLCGYSLPAYLPKKWMCRLTVQNGAFARKSESATSSVKSNAADSINRLCTLMRYLLLNYQILLV